MTATWNLESCDDQIPVRLGFYAGRSAMRPNFETYGVRLGRQIKKFNNPFDADRVARSLGVQAWRFVDRNRAFPFAAILPIRFADAPDDTLLRTLISRYESGESLQQLVDELNTELGTTVASVATLRMWLLGNQPGNANLNGLRPQRYRRTTPARE